MKTYTKLLIVCCVLTAVGVIGTAIAVYDLGNPISPVDINSHSNYEVVYIGQQYTVTCTTSIDEDCNTITELYVSDPVTHTWSGAGTFDPTTGTSVTWTAPNTIGDVNITVTASDSPLADDTDKTDTVTLTVTEPVFCMGVYIYDYAIVAAANEANETYYNFMDEHLAILKNKGVNAIYVGGAGGEHPASKIRFEETLELIAKYNMSIIPQLDFAYFRPGWNTAQVEERAQTAANFINDYIDNPRILAWSVKEEVAAEDVNDLALYYSEILERAPGIKLNLIHSSYAAANSIQSPYASITGADLYTFYWTVSGDGYLASPRFGLDYLKSRTALYYDTAAERGADFMLTVTQGGLMIPKAANYYAKDPNADPNLQAKVLAWAEDGRMGWGEFTVNDVNYYNAWKYYRMPKNCMKAAAWTGVLEGAKLFFNWSYTPTTVETSFEIEAKRSEPSRYVAWCTLAGRSGMTNQQLEDFNEVSGEIRAYERIITRMTKLEACPIDTNDTNTYAEAFSFPDMQGKVVVIINTNVGTWPANSAKYFYPNDDIFIDPNGNLVGYTAFEDVVDVNFSCTDPNDPNIFDIASGNEITKTGSYYKIGIGPGSGKLIFVGSSTEAAILNGKMGAIPD